MRKLYIYVIALISLVLIITCQKEEIEKISHPKVTTHEVTNITSDGATFTGELIFEGSSEIIDHGFVWGDDKNLSVEEDYTYSLGSDCSGKFSKDISFSLKENKSYYVKAYIKTKSHIVYGDKTSFKSLGSKAPELVDFYPKTATWSDTITIVGKNFNTKLSENSVKFNEFVSTVVGKASDTILTCIIPESLNTNDSYISISIFNNKNTASDLFHLTDPVINKLSVDSGVYKAPIEIYGRYFKENMTKLYFGSVESEISFYNDTTIQTEVPATLEMGEKELKIIVAGNEAIYNKPFKSLTPIITGVNNDSVLYGDTVFIYGKNFNPVTEYNNLYINNSNIDILQHTGDTISFILPLDVNLVDGGYKVSLEVAGIRYDYSTLLKLKQTKINSVSNNSIVVGDTLTIFGTNFHPLAEFNQVLIGEVAAGIIENSANRIAVIVPYNVQSNTNDLLVNTLGQSAFIPDYLNLLAPKILKITPEEGCREIEIAVIGENFSLNKDYNKVILNEDTFNVIKSYRDTIWFKINDFIEEGIKNVSIKVGSQTETGLSLYNHIEPWKKLEDIPGAGRSAPICFSIGEKIYLGGGYSKNVWLKDFWEYDPTTDSWNSKSEIPVENNKAFYGFSTETKGYFLHEKSLWSYNSVNNTWEEKESFPGEAEYEQSIFVVDNRIFVGNGYYNIVQWGQNKRKYTFELWEYNELTNSWIKRKDFPITNRILYDRVGFSIDSKGYMGSLRCQEQFWEYDVDLDIWSQSTDFSNGKFVNVSVSNNNKGYILTSYGGLVSNELYEYDPITKWKKLLDMPYVERNYSTGASINGKIYFGTGCHDYYYYNDFYEYDPSKDILSK